MEASIVVRLIDETRNGFNTINRNLNDIDRNTKNVSKSMDALKTAALGFATAVSGREIYNFINTVQSLDNRLKLVTNSNKELESSYKDLFDVAQRTRQPLDGTVTLFSRMSLAAENLGLEQRELIKITENFNKALSIGGATTAEAQSAMIQFSQALTSGKVEMQELRPLLDSAPVLMRELAKSLGLTAGEFRKMVSEGNITSKMLAEALLVATENLDRQFNKTSITVGQAANKMTNEFMMVGREILMTSGVSQGLVDVFEHLGANAGNIIEILKVLGVVVGAVLAYFNPWKVVIGLVTTAIVALADEIGPIAKQINDVLGTALQYVIKHAIGFGAALEALLDLENPFDAYSKTVKEYEQQAASANKGTLELNETQKQLNDSTSESNDQYKDLRVQLQNQVKEVKGTKDAYSEFIEELKREVEVSKLDSEEKRIQQTVYKALAAEAKKYGGDLSKVSLQRRQEIEEEVRAYAQQIEEENKNAEQRKKIQDELIRKQEEYDDFLEDSRTKNMTEVEKFYDAINKVEQDYRDGAIKNEEQYQAVLAAIRGEYQQKYEQQAKDFRDSQLTDEEKYQQAILDITEKYNSGIIASEETKNVLIEEARQKYGKRFDEIAEQQKQRELEINDAYNIKIQELEDAKNAGLIKSQEDYDAIRRSIEEKYREDVVTEYSSLYGALTDKIKEFTGLNQKEFGLLRDTVKLVFGVDINDIIKVAFAEMIKYVIGFREGSEGEFNLFGNIFNKVFGKGGTGQNELLMFADAGTGIMRDFVFDSGEELGGITGVLNSVFSGGLGIIAQFVKGGLELLSGFGKGASSLLGSIFDGIGSIFSGGGGGGFDILGSIGDLISGGGDFLGDLFGGIIDIGGDLFGGIGDFFGGLLDFDLGGLLDFDLGGLLDFDLGSLLDFDLGSGFFSGITDFLGPIGLATSLFKFGTSKSYGDRVIEAQNQASINFRTEYPKISENVQGFIDEFYSKFVIRDMGSGRYQIIDKASKKVIQERNLNMKAIVADTEYSKGFPGLGLPAYLVSGDTKYGATGLAFDSGAVKKYADGGIINRPTVFTTDTGLAIGGEAGTEAILPLERMSNGNLGVRSNMGAVNINININAVDAKGIEELLVENRQFLANTVRTALYERGRSLA